MRAAGYILTGLRQARQCWHSPVILAHGLASEFFGIEELAARYPDYRTFWTFPATARVLWQLRQADEMAGQSSVADFATWWSQAEGRIVVCTAKEAARAKRVGMLRHHNSVSA